MYHEAEKNTLEKSLVLLKKFERFLQCVCGVGRVYLLLLTVEVGGEGLIEEVIAESRGALLDGPDFPAEFEQFGFVGINRPGGDTQAICHFLDI